MTDPITTPEQMREAAIAAMENLTRSETTIGGQRFALIQLGEAVTAIRAIPIAPLPVAVTVKPLVWVDFINRGAKASAWLEANYMIQKWSDGTWELSASYLGYSTGIPGLSGRYSTLEAAKAAAQADYESRILSAIEAPPARDVRVLMEATHPDFIWGALDNVHDAETTLDDYAAAASRAIRAALALIDKEATP